MPIASVAITVSEKVGDLRMKRPAALKLVARDSTETRNMHLAHRLPYLLPASKIKHGLAARSFRGHATRNVGLGKFFDVEVDFPDPPRRRDSAA